jgi:GGDEF domain-containing protein
LSERLTRNLSKDTVIGRLAGDEFAMFIDDLPSMSTTEPSIARSRARCSTRSAARSTSISRRCT